MSDLSTQATALTLVQRVEEDRKVRDELVEVDRQNAELSARIQANEEAQRKKAIPDEEERLNAEGKVWAALGDICSHLRERIEELKRVLVGDDEEEKS